MTEPKPDELARAMDTIWGDAGLAEKMGRSARQHYDSLGLSWATVVKQLLA